MLVAPVARRRRRVFGIGMQEIMLICVIALIVVGPKRLPEMAKALGKGYGEFRRAFEDMKRSVQTDLQTEEIRRSLLDLPPPQAPAPTPKPESLLSGRPPAAADKEAFTYPGTLDGSPPPAEPPEPEPPPLPRADGQNHG